MKTDSYRLDRIADITRQLLDVLSNRGITTEDVLEDVETQWLVSTPLFNIGEQVNGLSKEFVRDHPDVPWSQIAGIRHRLVHHYEGTNWSIVASVLFDELNPFLEQVDALRYDFASGNSGEEDDTQHIPHE